MTTYFGSHVSPMGDEEPPRCEMDGTGHDIPVIEWESGTGRTYIGLGNHDDPAGYLREWAARLVALAEKVEAQAIDATAEAVAI